MCKSAALDTANKLQDIIRLLTLRSVEEGDGEDVARLQPSPVRSRRDSPVLRPSQPRIRDGNRNVRKSLKDSPCCNLYGDSVTEAASY